MREAAGLAFFFMELLPCVIAEAGGRDSCGEQRVAEKYWELATRSNPGRSRLDRSQSNRFWGSLGRGHKEISIHS